ncbi:MAG: Fe-S cluster assembly protein SufD [Spirochaetales bacterium]|nr:Fe-S cluster assembly protein SufD [Spirochaetales bacterium]
MVSQENTSTKQALALDKEFVEEFSTAAHEPNWLTSIRLNALDSFNKLEWPKGDEEEWRRTSLKKIAFDSYTLKDTPNSVQIVDGEEEISGIRFTADTLASFTGLKKEVGKGAFLLPLPFVGSLADDEANEKYGIIKVAMEAAADTIDNRFMAWNMSTWSHGAVLYVPDGIQLEDPVLLEYTDPVDGRLVNTQTLVILGKGSHATVVQRFAGTNSKKVLWNAGVTALIDDGARLSFTTNQHVSLDSIFVQNSTFRAGRDTVIEINEASTGGGMVKTRSEVYLNGPGADARLNGLYYTGSDQHMDLRTVQYHRDQHCESTALYKGAVAEAGRSVYQGLIDVEKNASGTDAYLTNNNLILENGAKADSIPCLEIRTNDVKCSHGSTSGKIDEEQLFYLMSRGIPREDARRELILGYFEDVIGRMPEIARETVRDNIISCVNRTDNWSR